MDNFKDARAHGAIALGEKVHNAKLTDRQAGAIKALRKPRSPVARLLAERFGLRKTYIYHLWYGLVWREAPTLALEEALAEVCAGVDVIGFCNALYRAFQSGSDGPAVVREFARRKAA